VAVKPAGLLSVGTERETARSAQALLDDYVRKGDPRSRNRVFVVHRLDRDTSGLILFARSVEARRFLQENWEDTDKHYLAIVRGHPTPRSGRISTYLVENAAQRVYSTPDPDQGKLSHTQYTVLQETRTLSLLDVHLLTGRKHQIRVQLAERGHPILGDRKYGERGPTATRLALHARSISFPHPSHGRRMTFDTGIPEEFGRLLGKR
jgi:tRNA pseudouridine32 synthase/23S rRNA pseudouridine746 synthase/23S rRNA pseudouridine1911/1915/1917 synthase